MSSDYSLPGDGLDYYPTAGDTVAIAVYAKSGHDDFDFGFGKDVDDFGGDNRIRVNVSDNRLALLSTDADGTERKLGETTVSLSETTWYIIEADYDGGGEGVHPTRIWSTDTTTDPGTRDTTLASIGSPEQDTTHQGRGIVVNPTGPWGMDYLHVLD